MEGQDPVHDGLREYIVNITFILGFYTDKANFVEETYPYFALIVLGVIELKLAQLLEKKNDKRFKASLRGRGGSIFDDFAIGKLFKLNRGGSVLNNDIPAGLEMLKGPGEKSKHKKYLSNFELVSPQHKKKLQKEGKLQDSENELLFESK